MSPIERDFIRGVMEDARERNQTKEQPVTPQSPSVRDRAAAEEIMSSHYGPTWSGCGEDIRESVVTRVAAILARHYSAPRPSTDRTKICLCGSTRFKRAWLEWNARLTLGEGAVVLTVAMWSHNERIDPTPEQKIMLDEIHKAKIDDSDEIFVLDVGGYIGSSTRSEIEHAERTNKRVRYLSSEFPEWTEEDSIYAGPLVPASRDERLRQVLLEARSELAQYSEWASARSVIDDIDAALSIPDERSVENG